MSMSKHVRVRNSRAAEGREAAPAFYHFGVSAAFLEMRFNSMRRIRKLISISTHLITVRIIDTINKAI